MQDKQTAVDFIQDQEPYHPLLQRSDITNSDDSFSRAGRGQHLHYENTCVEHDSEKEI